MVFCSDHYYRRGNPSPPSWRQFLTSNTIEKKVPDSMLFNGFVLVSEGCFFHWILTHSSQPTSNTSGGMVIRPKRVVNALSLSPLKYTASFLRFRNPIPNLEKKFLLSMGAPPPKSTGFTPSKEITSPSSIPAGRSNNWILASSGATATSIMAVISIPCILAGLRLVMTSVRFTISFSGVKSKQDRQPPCGVLVWYRRFYRYPHRLTTTRGVFRCPGA
mmetsp:Transcript_43645/g.44164  ORF Transcript_43645/g.44164 Transcript_43645/m.44164 type:complete len:218 (+) Transcript_43645:296-949(+)